MPTYPLPPLEEVRRWLTLPASSLGDEDLTRVLEAEAGLQADMCRVPVDATGEIYAPTQAHTQALYRRVGREVAAKGLPLGVMGADSEYGPSRLSRWDAEIDRLEGPSRVVVFG